MQSQPVQPAIPAILLQGEALWEANVEVKKYEDELSGLYRSREHL